MAAKKRQREMSTAAFVAVSLCIALPYGLVGSMGLGQLCGTSMQGGLIGAGCCYAVALVLGIVAWRLP